MRDPSDPTSAPVPAAEISASVPPPSSGASVDPAALLVALVLSPASYPRNRFFAMYTRSSLRKARWRAALLRGLVNAVARPREVVSDEQLVCHADGSKTLSYRVDALNLKVTTHLLRHEAAVVEVAIARIRCLPPPDEASGVVHEMLARLAPDMRPLPEM